VEITLTSEVGINYTPKRAAIEPDGSFTIKQLERGGYGVVMGNLPPNSYVKAIRFGGREVKAATIDLSQGASGPFEIELSHDAGAISGFVRDKDGEPVSLPIAVLDSGGNIAQLAGSRYDGAYRVLNLAPGEYQVVAVNAQISQLTNSPVITTLSAILPFSSKAVVTANSTVVVDLKEAPGDSQ
jgi:hypothetical protein